MRRALVALLLVGCAPTGPVYKPVEVQVPVKVACAAEKVERPDFATGHLEAGDDIAAKARAVLVELNQRKAYEAELEAQVEGCR